MSVDTVSSTTRISAMNGAAHTAAETRVAYLPTTHLRIDSSYQRVLNESRVRKMATTWSDAKADAITVSAREGAFIVLDGQHRLAAARRAGVKGLWALIHDNLTVADEAALFVSLNTERSRPKAIQIFKGRLLFDDTARAIESIVRENGWLIQLNDNTIHYPRRTVAVAALERIYGHGPDVLARTLQVCAAAWPDDVEHGRADVLLAVGNFINLYRSHPRFQLARLPEKLSEKALLSFRQRIRLFHSLSGSDGGGLQIAAGIEAVREAYNRDLRGGRLPQLSSGQQNSLIQRPDLFVWPA